MYYFNYSENFSFSKGKCIYRVVTWGNTADSVFSAGFLGHIYLRLLLWPNLVSIAKQWWPALWLNAGQSDYHALPSYPLFLCSSSKCLGKREEICVQDWILKSKRLPQGPFNIRTEGILSLYDRLHKHPWLLLWEGDFTVLCADVESQKLEVFFLLCIKRQNRSSV